MHDWEARIWLQTPVYFLHQFEEYVFPSGFLKFFNRNILKSTFDEFPMDKTVSFNMNAASHVGMFFRFGYNPSFVVSLLLNIPVGSYTLFYFYTNQIASTDEVIIGCIVSLLF